MTRSRSEGVLLRPFTKLEKIESIFDEKIALIVTSSFGKETLLSDAKITLPPKSISSLGLGLSFGGALEELVKALRDRFDSIEDLTWLVLAKDTSKGVLREAAICWQGGIEDLQENMVLKSQADDPSHPILANASTGYVLEFKIVVNKDLVFNPVRPSKKGTVVAEAAYSLVPVPISDGIQPKPLTEAIRKAKKLQDSDWFVVEFGDLLEAESFEDALTYYVDESLLDGVKKLGENLEAMSQATLVLNAINHLVFEVSRLLNTSACQDFEWEEQSGVVLNFIYKGSHSKLGNKEFVDDLRNEPGKYVTRLGGQAKLLVKLKKSVEELLEGNYDVSNDIGE